MFAKILVIYWS